MKLSSAILAVGSALLASGGSVSAFSLAPSTSIASRTITRTTATATATATTRTASTSTSTTRLSQYAQGGVDLSDEYAQRDVYAMDEWATQYGAQKAPGVELYSEDGADYQLVAQQGVGAGQTAIFVPVDICLGSDAIAQEFGGALSQAEEVLCAMDPGTQQRLPLFRLMAKILVEYDKGQESPFYPWLNSLPRQFYNGVSMTDACFSCLPPYAGWLASTERINYSFFADALRQGYVQLNCVSDERVVKWAYNVALTRFHEIWQPNRQKLIAPLADMLNHSAEPNCEVTFDQMGNCQVTAMYDIGPGTPLTISLGDPTNPTPIFAQYGFLPADCTTLFCKAMHLEPQIKDLGYDFKDLLFQTESGEIAPKVWDVFLYEILQNNDQGAADNFYVACKTNDEGTKQQYHDSYFQYTLEALKTHVYGIMADVENLTAQAQGMDQRSHPRVPVIVAHNSLVSNTFTMTAQLLEAMG